MKTITRLLKVLIIIFFSSGIIIFSEKAASSIISSINICLEVIIPSTFIFMVISTYILSSGLYSVIFRPIYFLFEKILKTDKRIISVFLLSLIGGYPVGFKLLKELIAENKNYSAINSYCAAFCYCISPSFAVTMIGLGLYKSVEAGIIVYISNVIACIIIGTIYGNAHRLTISTVQSEKIQPNQQGLISAINSSVISLVKMCAVIIFFNVTITVFECFTNELGINIPLTVKSILEISNILHFEPASPSAIPIISALASFGGICVIFQCVSLIDKAFSLKHFIISRFFSAAISFIVAELILFFWDISCPAYTSGGSFYMFDFNANKGATLFLLIMCIILMQKNEKNLKKG